MFKPRLHITILFLVISAITFAQKGRTVQNLRGFDKYDKLHFGFFLGINNLSAKITRDPNLHQYDTLYVFEIQPKKGFDLGALADLHFGEFVDLRLSPSLAFAQRDFEYTVKVNGSPLQKITRPVESTLIEVPITFKYKSERYNNFRAYFLGGVKGSFDLASQKDVDKNDHEVVRLQKIDYGYQYGFGTDFYLEYFKFAVQLKFYNGLRNLLIQDPTEFSQGILDLRAKNYLISITFEG